MQQVDREGYFKGQIVAYALEENEKTGTYNLSIQVQFDEHYNTDTAYQLGWYALDGEVGAYGYLNLVKRDKTLNDINVTGLIEHAGWNRDFEALGNVTWQPIRCGFKVKRDEYNGKVSYKVDGINSLDFVPGEKGKAKANPQAGANLNRMFGSQVRALASTLKRNATPPASGKPPAPPPAPKRELPKHDDLPEDTGTGVDENGNPIPF